MAEKTEFLLELLSASSLLPQAVIVKQFVILFAMLRDEKRKSSKSAYLYLNTYKVTYNESSPNCLRMVFIQ